MKNEPVHPFGLAVYGDYIFWTDWVRRAVLRADKYTGGDMKVLRADIPQQPMGIIAVANDTNSCTYDPVKSLSGFCTILLFHMLFLCVMLGMVIFEISSTSGGWSSLKLDSGDVPVRIRDLSL